MSIIRFNSGTVRVRRGLAVATSITAASLCATASATQPVSALSPFPAASAAMVGKGAPANLSSQQWAQVQAQIARHQYDVAAQGAGVLYAVNPDQHLSLKFTDDGVTASSGGKTAWSMQMQTREIRRGALKQSLADVAPQIAKDSPTEVDYHHESVTEWYRNTSAGVEHGYTLSNRPLADAGASPVEIGLDFGGMHAHQQGKDLHLADAAGHSLNYGHLVVRDAAGRELPSQMHVQTDGSVTLAFDDTSATYPVMVDPLLSSDTVLTAKADGVNAEAKRAGASVAIDGDTMVVGATGAWLGGAAYIYSRVNGAWEYAQTLKASDSATGANFGVHVAISDGTVVVTANYAKIGNNATQGAAYVFTQGDDGWTQQAELTATDGAAYANLGSSVSIDGDTVAVGATGATIGSNYYQGAVYVFTRSGSDWSQAAKLYDAAGMSSDSYGVSVSLSGDTLLVGASYSDKLASNAGAVYVYTGGGSEWSEQAELTESGGVASDYFGASVAISGDTAVIGATGWHGNGLSSQGAALVFSRDASGSWSQQALLTDATGAASDTYGTSVAIDGDALAVGGMNSDPAGVSSAGEIFVYARNGSSWNLQNSIAASDALASAQLGTSVSIDGSTVVGGAPSMARFGISGLGAAYVFDLSGSTYKQTAEFTPTDGQTQDGFGYAMSASGDTLVVGAGSDDVLDANGNIVSNAGAAYVFVRDSSGQWTQQAQLMMPAPVANSYFGQHLALDGDTLLVGVSSQMIGANYSQGAAYIFKRTGTSWSSEATLSADDGAAYAYFGTSVGLSGDTALIGSSGVAVNGKSSQGQVYVYSRSNGAWTLQTKLVASDGAASANFGTTLAFSGDTALIGATGAAVGGVAGAGAAYIFSGSGDSWTQQGKLSADTPLSYGAFGTAVALSGDSAMVGTSYSGAAAYIFVNNGGSWSQQGKLTASDQVAYDGFGQRVAIDGDIAVVGAPYHSSDSLSYNGRTYIFTRSDGVWTERTGLSSPGAATYDYLGFAVAVKGSTVYMSRYAADTATGGIDAGAVDVVDLSTDFGDAPDPGYPTLLASDGARHLIDSDGPYLGSGVDAELDGQPNSGATGDDIAGDADEDGVSFGVIESSLATALQAKVHAPSGAALLDVWIDFNQDGDWDDAGEKVIDHEIVVDGDNTLSFNTPAGAISGNTYARVRISSAGTSAPTGMAPDGEVEDYYVPVLGKQDVLVVESLARANASPTNASTLAWTVTFNRPVTGVDLSDFALRGSGTDGAVLTGISGSGSVYTVTANGGSSNGTLRLDLVDDDSITAVNDNQPLGGTGTVNGNFTGESYTLDFSGPSVTVNQAASQLDPTGDQSIHFAATFSEVVEGFDASDISIGGTAGATTATITGSGSSFDIAISGMTHSGTVTVSIPAGAVTDAAGNQSSAATSTDNLVNYSADILADAFSFDPVTGAEPGSAQDSNVITVGGINASTPITVVGGEYSINGGAFTSEAGTVNDGDAVQLRLTASSDYDTKTHATVAIGVMTGVFYVTTRSEIDTSPDAFSFDAVTDADPGSEQVSNTITVSGIAAATAISITGGEYSINGGDYVTAPGTVNEGDTVSVRVTADADFASTISATLQIGDASATFSVKTKADTATGGSTTTPTHHSGGGAFGPFPLLFLGLVALLRRRRHGNAA